MNRRAKIAVAGGVAILAGLMLAAPARAAFYKDNSRLPASCQNVADSALLDCYLSANFRLRGQITWEVPGRTFPTTDYGNWPASLKSSGRASFLPAPKSRSSSSVWRCGRSTRGFIPCSALPRTQGPGEGRFSGPSLPMWISNQARC